MTIAYVNGITAQSSGLVSSWVSSAYVLSSGNALVVGVAAQSNGQTFTITDSVGNTYTGSPAANGSNILSKWQMFYATNVIGGTVTFTANMSNLGDAAVLIVEEYSGVATVSALDADVRGAEFGASSTMSAGPVSSTQASEVAVCSLLMNSTSGTFTAGSGFTKRHEVLPGNRHMMASQDQILTSTVSNFTATASGPNSTTWFMGMLLLKGVSTTSSGGGSVTLNPAGGFMVMGMGY